jgi:hypothetical protein
VLELLERSSTKGKKKLQYLKEEVLNFSQLNAIFKPMQQIYMTRFQQRNSSCDRRKRIFFVVSGADY